jgi:16S rRNA (guanine(966)-N(2))-methyltransferase RsmD
MQVTTGSAKGRKLRMVPGDSTRPITDRAKQALFSILGDWIIDTHVLDLFAGTGSVGIEALSRGATFALFVDLNRKAVETVETNLRHCGLAGKAAVERADSTLWLQRYRGQAFDFIYVAPPQYQGMWRKTLLQIDQRPELLAPLGVVVAQIHPREDVPVQLTHLQEYDRREYGSVMLIFYAAASELAADEMAGENIAAEEMTEGEEENDE